MQKSLCTLKVIHCCAAISVLKAIKESLLIGDYDSVLKMISQLNIGPGTMKKMKVRLVAAAFSYDMADNCNEDDEIDVPQILELFSVMRFLLREGYDFVQHKEFGIILHASLEAGYVLACNRAS